MKKKSSLITLLTVAIIALAVLILFMNILDIHFNLITYHTSEQNGYTVSFKGSFKTVRRATVKKDGSSLGTLKLNADANVYSDSSAAVLFLDVNADETADILLPTAVDEDGDVHYSAFLAENGKFAKECVTDSLIDPTVGEDGLIYTDEEKRIQISPETSKSPESYEIYHTIARHGFIDGAFVTLETRSIIYYSENDYCCYSVYAYDEEFGELTYIDEKWFEPSEAESYPLNWD